VGRRGERNDNVHYHSLSRPWSHRKKNWRFVATKDFWAGIAHFIIPDLGPSGRQGFNDRPNISHEVLEGRQHSDFFKEEQMPGRVTANPEVSGARNPLMGTLEGLLGVSDKMHGNIPTANGISSSRGSFSHLH
jgi:hypothetical protein